MTASAERKARRARGRWQEYAFRLFPLTFKEWRGLKPFRAFILVVGAMVVIIELCTTYPDQSSLAARLTSEDMATSGALICFLMAFALSSGILIREHDDSTIEFVDALPTTRGRLFAAKFVAGFLVLLIFPLICTGLLLFTHGLSRTSLDPSWHLDMLARSLFLDACQTFVLLSLCFVLSFCRRFAWIVMGLAYWFYQFLKDRIPELQLANVFELTQPYFEGQTWILPWKMIFVQGVGALLCLSLARLFFQGGDRYLKWYRRWTDSLWGRIVLATSTCVVVLLSLVWIVQVSKETKDDAATVEAAFPKWSPARASTTHYTFVYPSNLEKRAQELIERADEVHEKVRSFLGGEPLARPIAVDLSGAGHQSGLAYWEAIRMDLARSSDAESLASVLAHETTHVFIERLSNRRVSDHFNSTRFFHEGLASYVETHLFAQENKLERLQWAAAISKARDQVDFKDLADNRELTSKYDLDIVYALGREFVAALVDVHGLEAPSRVVKSFRELAGAKESGAELWYKVFQQAGYNLDSVLGRFHENLNALVTRHAELIAGLPQVKARVVTDRHWVGVEPVGATSEIWDVVCRFRPGSRTDDSEYLDPEVYSHRTYWVHRHAFNGRTFWYQMGIRHRANGCVIYDRWVQSPLP